MGNERSVFRTMGASNHTAEQRAFGDYYATQPIAMELLLREETFCSNIWECACGEKHLSQVLERYGYNVRNSDLIDRCGNEVYDFLSIDNTHWNGDIITNPPYSAATDFVRKAMTIIDDGRKVAMFLRLLFLEGKERKHLFHIYPPKIIYVSSSRITCAKNGDFATIKNHGAVSYAWFVWVKGYNGETVLKWIN